jgi:hypothetical protein
MQKKILFIELSTDVLEKIDEHNNLGSRSTYVSELLEKKFNQKTNATSRPQNDTLRMHAGEILHSTGEIELRTSQGETLGQFNINTGRGYDNLSEKIAELSENPMVQMKARCWR